MNLKSLRAFLHIIDEGTLVAASRNMNLSQPAVSRLIQLLEEEIGTKLFYRDQKSLAPTPEADLFYPEAQRVVSAIDDFPGFFQQLRDNTLVPLRILCQLRAANGLVIPAMVRFAKLYPDVRVALDVQPRHELSRSIQQAKFDVGVYVVPLQAKGIEVIEMREMPLQVLLPKGHRLAVRPYLTPKDMVEEKYVAVRRGLMAREAMDRVLARAGETLEVFHEVSGTAAAHRLVAGGIGFTFSDPTVLEPGFQDNTVLVPWQPEVKIGLGLFSPQNYTPHEATGAFLDCLKGLWDEQVDS
ncbi:MAG: LysR family transcriptional regulator [Paracoccaceae bacterium]|uniref:LysR family transcriptional regulator n=1 Tax=Sulfitobacter sp. TaxID=1903071 RepID=UPI0032638F9B